MSDLMDDLEDEKTEEIRPDLYLIAWDETEGWYLPDEQMKHIKSIESIYTYDRNSRTFACEMTPSYDLFFVDVRVSYKDPDFAENHPDLEEEIHDSVVENADHDSILVHCHTIDAMIERWREEGKEGEMFEHHGDVEDADIEDIRGDADADSGQRLRVFCEFMEEFASDCRSDGSLS